MPEEFACYLSLPANQGDDIEVLFPAERVLASGDLFTNGKGLAELVDYAGGGSAKEWTTTLDGVLTLRFDSEPARARASDDWEEEVEGRSGGGAAEGLRF